MEWFDFINIEIHGYFAKEFIQGKGNT